MLVLVIYDVNTVLAGGQKRLRQVAKVCEDYGVRVQNSSFECQVDAAKARKLEAQLTDLINPDIDSLRLYYLGNNYKGKVVHIGAKPVIDVTEPLVF